MAQTRRGLGLGLLGASVAWPAAAQLAPLPFPGDAAPTPPQVPPAAAPPGMPGGTPGAMPGALPGQVPQQGAAPPQAGGLPPIPQVGPPDATGQAGIRALHQYVRRVGQMLASGQRQTAPAAPPPGWARALAHAAPGMSIDHPQGWIASIHASVQQQQQASAVQARVVSPDNRHVFEGESAFAAQTVPVQGLAEGPAGRYAQMLQAQTLLLRDTWTLASDGGLWTLNFHVLAGESQAFTLFAFGAVATSPMLMQMGSTAGNMGWKLIVGPRESFSATTTSVWLPMLLSAGW